MNEVESRRPLILIVDDVPMNIKVLASALGEEYNLQFALSGEEALAIIRKSLPDLVLLDIMMPKMDGFEVYRQLNQMAGRTSEIPVIFVTALEDVRDESTGLTLGAVDYIRKPFNTNLVRLRVRNQMELKRQRDLLKEQRDLLARRTRELEESLARIKRLEGIISICMFCKKIRTEDDSWQQLERYITEHSDAVFSHGVCPDCYEEQKKLIEEG